MHKTVLALLVFIFITTSYLAVDLLFSEDLIVKEAPVSALGAEDIVPEESIFADLKIPLATNPTKITFADTTLEIEKIGLEPDGQLQVPSSWELAGWYQNSAKPGEKGNVIIDGHYDTNTSEPAAFWGLKNLKVNDTVFLQDELRREFSYRIIDSFYVDITDPLRTKVFDETGEAELTLVTCGGVWDSVAGTYNKRLVIRAVLL